MQKQTKKLEFCVVGMHCAACELTIEKELSKVSCVSNVDAKLNNKIVTLDYSGDENIEALVEKLSHEVEDDGYKIVVESSGINRKIVWKEYLVGGGIAAFIILIYLSIERLGLLSFGSGFELNFVTAFFIGIIASLSTCAAVVGGLVLSLSANAAKTGKVKSTLISFHVARLVTFAVLGFVLGFIGQTITSNPNFNLIDVTFWMKTFLAVVLIILSLSLLDVVPNISKFQLTMPKSIAKGLIQFDKLPTFLLPAFTGFVTFFLPCGFTQSIQLSGLVSADPARSSITLFTFALGTLPVLALISFASTNIAKSLQSGIFYKMAGFLIFALAISEAAIAYRISVGS